jgi:hypothetical protein
MDYPEATPPERNTRTSSIKRLDSLISYTLQGKKKHSLGFVEIKQECIKIERNC